MESWGEVKSFPSQWEGERKIGEGGGGGERINRLPALIVRLRNSVRGRTESLIGAVELKQIDTCQLKVVFLPLIPWEKSGGLAKL